MARLPNPGGDDNQWGNLLNDFLAQEHNPDGTQKTLDVAKGGTGATTPAGARTNLGTIADTDPRLSDQRTPSDSSVTDAKVAAGANIAQSKIAGLTTALQTLTNDSLAGQEIGYGENVTLVSTTSSTLVDIPGCSVVIPAGTRPVVVEFGATVYASVALTVTSIGLSLSINGGAYDLVRFSQFKSINANDLGEVSHSYRLPASAQPRTVKLGIARVGGSGTVQAQGQVSLNGVFYQPTYIHARWG